MLNPPPQWGTPHPTYGYLANEDRAQSPPIDLDLPLIGQSVWGPVSGSRGQCRRAKASRVRAMMAMARCDHSTAEAAHDDMKSLMHNNTVEHERGYILSWAKYTILANEHLEALQPHCKDGKLPPEQDQPGPHDESPSLNCKQPTAAHRSTAALNRISAPEPTHPGPPVCRHMFKSNEHRCDWEMQAATVETGTAQACDIADEEKANRIMSRCLPYGMEAACTTGSHADLELLSTRLVCMGLPVRDDIVDQWCNTENNRDMHKIVYSTLTTITSGTAQGMPGATLYIAGHTAANSTP